jgi:DNA invertase Pin-like site-specific DNA recombinase
MIAYIRVSTKEQAISGLSFEAQRAAISRLGTITQEFVETCSGRDDDRPVLAAAIVAAKQSNVPLCVARLDRFSRRVSFAAKMLESNVQIIVADMPTANTMTLHIMACVAEQESKLISERTKAAMAAAKAKGALFGSARPGHWDGIEHLRGRRKKGSKVKPSSQDLLTQVRTLRQAGLTLQEIAELLDAQGKRTATGKTMTRTTIHRLLKEAV